MNFNPQVYNYANPAWDEAVRLDYQMEVEQEDNWPIVALNEKTRKLIWYLSRKYNMHAASGISGAACRLMERFLARYLRTFLRVHDDDEWEECKNHLASRCCLLASVCIQLVSKMSDSFCSITATRIQEVLFQDEIMHSREEILSTELLVFQTLDYRIPLWTSLQTAQYLASRVGITSGIIMQAVAIVIDLAEFYRYRLQYYLLYPDAIVPGPDNGFWNIHFESDRRADTVQYRVNAARYTIHTLHLCAASVCAAACYMGCDEDYVIMLAHCTHIWPTYLRQLTNLILFKILIPPQ